MSRVVGRLFHTQTAEAPVNALMLFRIGFIDADDPLAIDAAEVVRRELVAGGKGALIWIAQQPTGLAEDIFIGCDKGLLDPAWARALLEVQQSLGPVN